MGVEARKTASNGFSWNDYGQRYVQYLEQLVKKI
jgi:hypothetical protein